MVYNKSNTSYQRAFMKTSCLINAACILVAAGSASSWAHPGGGGFHGRGGFGGGGFSHNYGGAYHSHGGYHAEGVSEGYHGVQSYHNALGPSPFGRMHQFQNHSQTVHSFNHAPVAMNHMGGMYRGGVPGHATWGNHGYWHGSYWHGGYGSWVGRPWGWGNGFVYGAFFGAAVTTAFFLPPLYSAYYYPPEFYYPGPYSYTVIVNEYPPMPAPPLRLPAQNVETWVAVNNGRLPANAVINSSVRKQTTYYCRVHYNGKMSYGVLVPREGCYIEKPSVSMRFSKYDVLVSSLTG